MAEDGIYSDEPEGPTRRQLIRKGMVAGGLALWSAPLVAVGLRQWGADTPTPEQTQGVVPMQDPPNPCVTGYPPGCASGTSCGTGELEFCMCVTDIAGNCVCISLDGDDEPFLCGPEEPCGPGSACLPFGPIGRCEPLCRNPAPPPAP